MKQKQKKRFRIDMLISFTVTHNFFYKKVSCKNHNKEINRKSNGIKKNYCMIQISLQNRKIIEEGKRVVILTPSLPNL